MNRSFLILVLFFTLALSGCENSNGMFLDDSKVAKLNQQAPLVQIPKQTSEQIFASKAKCQKDGTEFYAKQEHDYEEISTASYTKLVLPTERYTYNSELNTCLVAWDYLLITNNFTTTYHEIRDIYSNELIYLWVQIKEGTKNPEDSTGNTTEYEQKLRYYGLK